MRNARHRPPNEEVIVLRLREADHLFAEAEADTRRCARTLRTCRQNQQAPLFQRAEVLVALARLQVAVSPQPAERFADCPRQLAARQSASGQDLQQNLPVLLALWSVPQNAGGPALVVVGSPCSPWGSLPPRLSVASPRFVQCFLSEGRRSSRRAAPPPNAGRAGSSAPLPWRHLQVKHHCRKDTTTHGRSPSPARDLTA